MSFSSKLPVVLVFAGNDPSGGAGLSADVLTLASLGCHALPVVTALTVQDTARVYSFQTIEAGYLDQQARHILKDVEVNAIKVGMIGNIENVAVIAQIARDYPDIPLVLDPVLASGFGDALSTANLASVVCHQLLPYTWLLTPNSIEARQLAAHGPRSSLKRAAQQLIRYGARAVLITGTHEKTADVVNTLYCSRGERPQASTWKRLPGSYHGSGCTLAAAIAARLASGSELSVAINEAQIYTWQALYHAYCPGKGQSVPNRLFLAKDAILSEKIK